MGDRIYVADKPTQDAIYNILAAEPVYGFIEHCNILDPTQRIEYIGANKDYTPLNVNLEDGSYDLNSWADFPFLKGNKPYMVKSDGTPDYRLDENDYTKKEDGTASDVANSSYDGGAFAWIPKIYKSEYMAGDDRYVLFRFTKAEGYEAEGFIDPEGNELEGVWLPMFYGSVVNSKMMSIADQWQDTASGTGWTTDAQKNAIDAASSRGVFFGGAIVNTLVDLMLMFAKNCNLQDAYGYGNRSGYDASDEHYGMIRNGVVGGGQFYGTNDGKSLNKVFHSLVLITQNLYTRDPYTVVVNGRVKVSPDYAYDVTGATYQDTGIDIEAPESEGWIYPHRYLAVPHFGSFPVAPYNGSTSTGGCDGFYRSSSQATITAVALRLGNCNRGSVGGPRCVVVARPASYVAWSCGAAILLLPPAGVAA